MPIPVSCPSCSAAFKVKDEYAGKRAKCPKCGNPLTIPAPLADFEVIDDEPAPKPVVAARPVVASKPKPAPVPADDDADEPVRPKRKRGDDDEQPRAKKRARDDDDDDAPAPKRKRGTDDDDAPKAKKRARDDDDDDAPKGKRRRRDDDDAPKKKGSPLLLILGIVGVLLLVGGGVAVWYVVSQSTVDPKVVLTTPSGTGKPSVQPPATMPQPTGEFVTEANLSRLRTGLTLAEVRAILGTESKMNPLGLTKITDALNDSTAYTRWGTKLDTRHFGQWTNAPDTILIAFSGYLDPAGSVTVIGVIGQFKNKTTEPVKLPDRQGVNGSAEDPVATLTIAELVSKGTAYNNKWVTLKCQVLGPYKKDASTLRIVAQPDRIVEIRSPFGAKGFDQPQDYAPLENLEVVGRVEANKSRDTGKDKFIDLRDAKIVRRTPSTDQVVKVTAQELCADFQKDSSAALTKYGGKFVQVIGRVHGGSGGDSIKFDSVKFPTKEGGEASYEVQFDFPEYRPVDPDNAPRGENVTFAGKFARVGRDDTIQLTTIVIEECWVVK